MSPEQRAVALLAALDKALLDLERYEREVPYDRLVRDGDASRMVRQALQEAIQACVDLGEKLLADVGAAPPDTYRGIFEALRDRSGLPDDLAASLADAAGLRNILVHVYTQLDLALIHSAYTDERATLARFAAWAAERMS